MSINFPYPFLCLLLNAFQNILDSHIVPVLVNCLTEWVPIGPTCLSKGSGNLLLWQQVQTTLLDNCLCNSASHLNMYVYDHLKVQCMQCIKQLETTKLSWSTDGVFLSTYASTTPKADSYGNHSLLSRFTYKGFRITLKTLKASTWICWYLRVSTRHL